MIDGHREAGEFLLGRLVRLCAALADTADGDTAGQLLANRIGEFLSCDRALLVTLSPAVPAFSSGDVRPGERTVLADAIRAAELRCGTSDGPHRLEPAVRASRSLDGVVVSSVGTGDGQIVDALERCLLAYGGTRVLWWPLPERDRAQPRHALWLERHDGRRWKDEELSLAHRVGPVLGALLSGPKAAHKPRRALMWGAVVAAIALAGALPVPAVVTAPVQVTAAEPRHVFSGMDGIVSMLAVTPGQQVRAGDVLLRMDTRVLDKNVEEARQAVAVAQAELARNRAAAHYDAEARARLAVTQLELERAQLELDFHLAQLDPAELRSEVAGQVLLEDPDRLPGAAVRMGERLLSIADTAHTRLRIMVPLADFSLVDESAAVSVTLDRSPLSVLDANVVRKGYTVQLSDDQIPSIVVDADWAGPPPDVPFGARGSARISGDAVPLAQHLLRKPLQALRRIWGL